MAAGNQELIQSSKNPRFRSPLNVVVEKVGATRAMVHGDVSVESLKELLMSSLSLLPTTRIPDDYQSGLKKSDSPDSQMKSKNLEEEGSALTSRYTENKDELKIISGSTALGSTPMGSANNKEQKLMAKINGEVKANGKEITPELSAPKKIDDKIKSKRNIRDQTSSRLLGTKTGRKPKSGRVYDDGDEEYEEGSDTEDGVKSLSSCSSVFDIEESPFSNDGRWLQSHFKKPLVKGLTDLANKKPQDPVVYLAFWLRNYRREEEVRRRKIDFDKELLTNRLLAIDRTKEQENSTENIEPEYCGEGEEAGGSADWNFENYNASSEAVAI